MSPRWRQRLRQSRLSLKARLRTGLPPRPSCGTHSGGADIALPTLWTWNQALAWCLNRDLALAANPPWRPSVAARYPKPDSDGNYPPVYGTVAEFRRAVDDGLLSQPEPRLFDAAQVMRVFPAPADRIAAETTESNAAHAREQELPRGKTIAAALGRGTPSKRRLAYKGELVSFMRRLQRARLLGDLDDDNVAQRFEDEVASKVQAGRSVLKLPQRRHIANQVAKLRPEILSRS
jgi:hypothetical protein